MNISVIDYIGKVHGGIAILLSWIIDGEYFEFIFWFDKNNEYKVYSSDKLNSKLGVEDIQKWSKLEYLIIYVNLIIPSKNDIFNEFNI